MTDVVKNIDIVVLCGGLGKRLRNIIRGVPKPMVKLNARPFLDIIIYYMAGFGFRRFILTTGYKAKVIKDYYSNNPIPGLSITFSQERIPLDTGGAVKNAKTLIKSNPFFVLNGDSFCKFNPITMLNFHKQKKSLTSVLLKKVSAGNDYGEIQIDRYSRIVKFNEKNMKAKNCLINAGVYVFDKEIFSLMPTQAKFSLEFNLFPDMAGKSFFGHTYRGFFIDISTPERYFKARRYFLRNKQEFIR